MSDLTEFLLARIEEDERLAEVVPMVRFSDNPRIETHSPARVRGECEAKRRIVERASRPVYRRTFDSTEPPTPFAELTFFGGRVYAAGEVDVTEAYQQEVAAHSEPADPETLRDLASVYADHPDFREELATMTEFSRGGVICGEGTFRATLAPDECLLDRDGNCQRTDLAHNGNPFTVRTWDGNVVAEKWGPCLHRHPVPVESTVTGEVVAHLCPACDEQLP